MRSLLPLVPLLLLLNVPTATAQVALDRTPNLAGTWVPDPGVVRFDFLHRFWVTPGPSNAVVNYPTFTFAVGLPSRLALGLRYSTRSETPGENNEAEVYARWQAPAKGPLRVSLTPAYNSAAQSVEGELSVDWTRDPLTLSAAARVMSRAYGNADRGTRSAFGGGAVLRLNDYVAIGGDVASLVNPDPSEAAAWSVGLLFVIPSSPHTFSLHVSNVDVNTIQGGSREGLHRVATSKPLYGFEFTIPLHLSRFAPWFGGRSRGGAAPPPADLAADIGIGSFRYQRDTVYVQAGQAVRWINADPVEHTVTFATGGPQSSTTLATRDAFVARFDRPGTYPYHCTPHPYMRGVVVVR